MMRAIDRAALVAATVAAAAACAGDDPPGDRNGAEPAAEPYARAAGETGGAGASASAPEPEVFIDENGVETTVHRVDEPPTPDWLPVVEVERLIEAEEAVLCDVNVPEARAHFGVVPGARLLSHPSRFELDELPADRDVPLIFYCSTPSCGASLRSGTRAILAGFTEVYAMRGGVAGWLESGRETEPH